MELLDCSAAHLGRGAHERTAENNEQARRLRLPGCTLAACKDFFIL